MRTGSGTPAAGHRLVGAAVLLLFSLAACATPVMIAENALLRGDYAAAAEASLQALKENPRNGEAERILADAWSAANGQWRSALDGYRDSRSVWEAEKALTYYEKLMQLHALVLQAGRVDMNPDPDGIRRQRDDAVAWLADKHLFEGSKLIVPGTRDEALAALAHFRRVKALKPDYPFIDGRISQAEEKATAKVFVFTGPERDVTLNGTEIVPGIEDGLEQLEGVQVVRVKARYAAPIDDNYQADDFARGHGANLMLHVEPATRRSVAVKKDVEELFTVPWEIETLRLEASAVTDVRYVLINLETDALIGEGTFSVTASDDGGFAATAVLHGGSSRAIDQGSGKADTQMLFNRAPVRMDDIDFRYKLLHNDGLNVTRYAATGSLNLPAALDSSGNRIELDRYTHPSELADLPGLQGHLFWLFDAILYDAFGDGDLTYQFIYQQQLDAGIPGHMKTAAYERDLYKRIEAWMKRNPVQKVLMDQFFPLYYTRFLPAEIAARTASLFR